MVVSGFRISCQSGSEEALWRVQMRRMWRPGLIVSSLSRGDHVTLHSGTFPAASAESISATRYHAQQGQALKWLRPCRVFSSNYVRTYPLSSFTIALSCYQDVHFLLAYSDLWRTFRRYAGIATCSQYPGPDLLQAEHHLSAWTQQS